MIGSDLFMAVSMAAMGTYSYIDENKGNPCENSTSTILQSMVSNQFFSGFFIFWAVFRIIRNIILRISSSQKNPKRNVNF